MAARHQKRMSPHTATVWAFVITLLLCAAGVAAWLVFTAPPSSPPAVDEPSPDPTETVNAAVLLILTDADAPHFVYLSPNAEQNAVRAVALPPQTARTNDGDSLEMLFADEGATACAKEVGNLLHVDTPWVAVMSYQEVQAFIDRLPHGLIYDLPERVTHQTEEYYLRLEPGPLTLTGGQAEKLLRYGDWKLGQLQRVKVHAIFVAAWWNQYATASYVKDLDEDYVAWYDGVQTNLTIAPFTALKTVWEPLWKQNDGKQCQAVLPAGVFVGNGDTRRYVLKE